MKKLSLLILAICIISGYQLQAQCYATIGVQQNPNSFVTTLWADNFVGDTANTTFYWSFCDGSTDNGLQIFHSLASGGMLLTNCQVCLTLSDAINSCTFTTCDTVNATGIPPNTNCNAYATFTNQDSLYTFFASSTGGTPVVYEWTVNGVAVDTTTSFSQVIDPNTFINGASVCVSITDASGCVASDCITIGNNGNPSGGVIPCQAYFAIYPDTGANSSGLPGYYMGYNLSSGNYGSNVLWDFGDGSTSNDPYPVHVYAAPGNYIVCLTVGTPGTNCYDTYCDSSFYVFKTEGGEMTHLTILGPSGLPVTEPILAQFYPNPFSQELFMCTGIEVEQVRILSPNGQLLLQTTNTSRIGTAFLSSGIYFVQTLGSDGHTITTQKFIKQ